MLSEIFAQYWIIVILLFAAAGSYLLYRTRN